MTTTARFISHLQPATVDLDKYTTVVE